jgi:NAD(P)-dependent dehydrogenase (short-subunit alcohol dehydrogenase family)
VVVVGRDQGKTSRLAAELGAKGFTADFADLARARQLAADLRAACPRIDILVNNAGAIVPGFAHTPAGREKTFQVKHLAPFLLWAGALLLATGLISAGIGLTTATPA